MKWMREYQGFLEVMIRTYNKYSTLYTKQNFYGTDDSISLAQIQVVETVLKNKGNYMTFLSKSLGITKGTLSKSITKLEKKGIVERYKLPDNNKEIYIRVTEKGERIYKQYLKFTYDALFGSLLNSLEQLDETSLEVVKNMFITADTYLEKMHALESSND